MSLRASGRALPHPSLDSRPEIGGVRIPRAPAELHAKWVLWLILCGRSNAEIGRMLADDALPCPPPSALNGRRSANRPPRGFSIRPPFNPDTEFYLRMLRLDRLALGAHEARGALRVLHAPRLRELVETGLIVNAARSAIAGAARERLGTTIESEAIESFEDIFFRLELLTRGQLEIAVEDRVRVCLSKAASKDTDAGTFAQALGTDPRVLASTARRSAKSWPAILDATR
jgi:hypothetical protein